MSLDSAPIVVVAVAVIVAAVTDLWAFKIHNALTLPLLASGLIYHGMVGGSSQLAGSFLGMLFGFSILFLVYLLGGIGGGDVKLMAGIGAWLGMPLTYYVFVVTALMAGLFALVLVVANGRLREVGVNLRLIWHRCGVVARHFGTDDRMETELNRTDRRARVIPYGLMMAIGVLTTIVYFWIISLETQ